MKASASNTSIEVALEARQDAFRLDAAFQVPARGVISLFGPSGSGKSTLLRCMAGLHANCTGVLRFNGATWQDDSTRLPAHKRPIGFVFQDVRLFPHMNVHRNVQYGQRRVKPDARTMDEDQVIEWLGLAPLLDRMPDTLSGGERQRVAIGRAMLTSPRLLMMDEPISALDEGSRADILPYLSRLLRELAIPCLYVSHTLNEVLQIAHTMVCIREGRVVAVGPPPEVAGQAAGRLSTVLPAVVRSHDAAAHLCELETPAGPFWVPETGLPTGSTANLLIEAQDVSLARRHEPDCTLINQVPLTVHAVAPWDEGQVRVTLVSSDGTQLAALITERSRRHMALEPGQPVYARVKGTKLLL